MDTEVRRNIQGSAGALEPVSALITDILGGSLAGVTVSWSLVPDEYTPNSTTVWTTITGVSKGPSALEISPLVGVGTASGNYDMWLKIIDAGSTYVVKASGNIAVH